MNKFIVILLGLTTLSLAEFTKSGNIVTDSITGLQWQDEPYTMEEDQAYSQQNETGKVLSWENAIDYCENLTLDGYSNWRLPNINELNSIVDRNKAQYVTADGFSEIFNVKFASSTSYATPPYTDLAWYVDFSNAKVYNDNTKNNIFAVRCVRTPEYTRDDTKEIVTYTPTGLMWQDNSEATSTRKKWVIQTNYDAKEYDNTSGDTATTYCTDLTLGGYSDWRLPTVEELNATVDKNADGAKIKNAFKNSVASFYWTSITNIVDSDVAWVVNFKSGVDSGYHKDGNLYVRCVREEETPTQELDTTPPILTITDNQSGTATTTDPISFTFTWNEEVNGFDINDIVVAGGTKGEFTIIDSSTYRLPITPNNNSNTAITINIAAQSVTDYGNNANDATPQYTQEIDTRGVAEEIPYYDPYENHDPWCDYPENQC